MENFLNEAFVLGTLPDQLSEIAVALSRLHELLGDDETDLTDERVFS